MIDLVPQPARHNLAGRPCPVLAVVLTEGSGVRGQGTGDRLTPDPCPPTPVPCPLSPPSSPRIIGWLCEVAPFVWWWRRPGNPFYAPAAAGPHQRDCVDVLLRLKDLPLPPRTGIPQRLSLVGPGVRDDDP